VTDRAAARAVTTYALLGISGGRGRAVVGMAALCGREEGCDRLFVVVLCLLEVRGGCDIGRECDRPLLRLRRLRVVSAGLDGRESGKSSDG